MANVRTEGGRVDLRGEEWFLAAVRPIVDLARRREQKEHAVREEAGVRAYLKCGPLPARAGVRHGLRALWPGIETPCLQEFDNLSWLRRNGFRAPHPLAAGCWRDAFWRPTYQFLYTQEVPDARTLRQVFEEGPEAWRLPALEDLGTSLAQLHGRGFVHRDLFPRNLLVTDEEGTIGVTYLDTWRGGPLPGLRGPAYDIACLMLFGADLFTLTEQDVFFGAYFGERERLGHRVRRDRVLRSAERQRRGLRRRFVKRRRATSVLPIPCEEWIP